MNDLLLLDVSRIVVIGMTGAGKTTLAQCLSRRLDLDHIELDALHWQANWTPAEREIFREQAACATSGERWVADGNYGAIRDIVWERAQLLIWLDYDLPVHFVRLIRRTFPRIIHRKELWNGNREEWGNFFSRESLFLWLLQHHALKRIEYDGLIRQPEHSHLKIVRLRSPLQTESWLRRSLLRPMPTETG